YPYTVLDPDWPDREPVPRELTVGEQTYRLAVKADFGGLPVNVTHGARNVLVLRDELVEQIVAGSAPEQRLRVTMWDVAGWRSREAAAAAEALSLRFEG